MLYWPCRPNSFGGDCRLSHTTYFEFASLRPCPLGHIYTYIIQLYDPVAASNHCMCHKRSILLLAH